MRRDYINIILFRKFLYEEITKRTVNQNITNISFAERLKFGFVKLENLIFACTVTHRYKLQNKLMSCLTENICILI